MKNLISTIVSYPHLHARWLNTFSLLEYTGFRKIVKSQNRGDLNFSVMAHASEEARHSLLFKRLALRLGGDAVASFEETALLAGAAADTYFQSLDCKVSERLPESKASRLNYLIVTWLVEIRAITIYGQYEEVLRSLGQNSPLASLLGEEELHLQQVRNDLEREWPEWKDHEPEIRALELTLFEEYVTALELELKIELQLALNDEISAEARTLSL